MEIPVLDYQSPAHSVMFLVLAERGQKSIKEACLSRAISLEERPSLAGTGFAIPSLRLVLECCFGEDGPRPQPPAPGGPGITVRRRSGAVCESDGSALFGVDVAQLSRGSVFSERSDAAALGKLALDLRADAKTRHIDAAGSD